MRRNLTVNLCVCLALGVGVLGLWQSWAPDATLFAALGSLVLGLAVARVLAFISARNGNPSPAQKDVP